MSEWISVKDKLPENMNTVIAYKKRKNEYVFAVFTGNIWVHSGKVVAKTAVTHWMPLPEPPEVNE